MINDKTFQPEIKILNMDKLTKTDHSAYNQ